VQGSGGQQKVCGMSCNVSGLETKDFRMSTQLHLSCNMSEKKTREYVHSITCCVSIVIKSLGVVVVTHYDLVSLLFHLQLPSLN